MAKTNAERQAEYRRKREAERHELINNAYCLGRLDAIHDLAYRTMESIVDGMAAMKLEDTNAKAFATSDFTKATHKALR